jgi:hypothetical protein
MLRATGGPVLTTPMPLSSSAARATPSKKASCSYITKAICEIDFTGSAGVPPAELFSSQELALGGLLPTGRRGCLSTNSSARCSKTMRSNFMNFAPKSMHVLRRVSGSSYREAAVHAQNSKWIKLRVLIRRPFSPGTRASRPQQASFSRFLTCGEGFAGETPAFPAMANLVPQF